MNSNLDSDESLMQQVVRGDRNAIEPLMRRHGDKLLTFIIRMVGNHQRGEELFQEVFLTIWIKRHQYDGYHPFKPWLYAIAINRCRQEMRRKWFRDFGDDDQITELAAPTETDPANRAIEKETHQIILDAVGQLPVVRRRVFALRVWSGLSFREIAQSLEQRESTVRSMMRRALLQLRLTLSDEDCRPSESRKQDRAARSEP